MEWWGSFSISSPSADSMRTNRRMRVKLPSKITRFALLVVGAVAVGTTTATAFDVKDRAALWYVVNDLCRPMQEALKLPIPCLKVDTEREFLVFRAPGDETQILIVPTTKIDGIEPTGCGFCYLSKIDDKPL